MRKVMLGLAPALLAMSGTAVAAAPAWRVSEVSGEVRLTEGGSSRAAVKGALLSSGATITTGTRARAVIVRGEEFVVISPRTQLRVPPAEEPNKIMQLIEDFGTAVFKINKKSTPHFGVKTPYLAAVVKGTTFTVTVGPEGSSVQVTEGAVEVSTLDGGAADLITPGSIAMVGASDLYQLSVEGALSKVLRSDQSPGNGSVTSGVSPTASPAYSGPAVPAVQIASPLTENPLSLSAVTGDLLEGSAAMELAAVEFADQTRATMDEVPLEPAPSEPEPPVQEPEPDPEPEPMPPAEDPEPEPPVEEPDTEPEPEPEPPVQEPEPEPGEDDGGNDDHDDHDHGGGKGDDKDDDPDDGNNGGGNDGRDDHDHGGGKGHDDHDHGGGKNDDKDDDPDDGNNGRGNDGRDDHDDDDDDD